MLSPEYWSAISTLPTIIMMAPSSGAGRTCCGTSTTSEPATPKTPHWPDGPRQSTNSRSAAKACNHHEPWQRRVAQLAWERKLLAICRPFLSDPSAVQGKLCRRIERHIKELFVFVAEPDVPADNNPAERSLRHLVISRKVSGGHPLGAGHRAQDDAGIPLRHLARPRSKSSRRLPSAARFPSTLNCYPFQCPHAVHPCPSVDSGLGLTFGPVRPWDLGVTPLIPCLSLSGLTLIACYQTLGVGLSRKSPKTCGRPLSWP